MKRANVQDIFPLTGNQQSMLVHALAPGPGDPGLIQVRFTLMGRIDDAEMAIAWNEALARHDALRLTVQMPAGKAPMLVMGKAAHLEIEEIRRDSVQSLDDLRAMDRAQPLDLAACPAMRLRRIRHSDTRRDYLWTCHHIFLDGWSATVILQEVLSLYAARREGRAADLPPPVPLRSHVALIRKRDGAASYAFWRGQLDGMSGAPATTRLRAATPPTVEAVPPEHLHIPVPEGLGRALDRAAILTRTTPAAILNTAWALMTAASADAADAGYCRTVSGRSVPLDGIDRLAGCLSGAVPVRCAIAPDDTVADIALRLHRSAFAAHGHDHLALGEVLTGPEAGAFDTLLVIQNHPWSDLTLDVDGGVTLTGATSEVTSNFPLTLIARPGEELSLSYVPGEALDAERAAAFVAQFPSVLAAICADPAVSRAGDIMAGIGLPTPQQVDPRDAEAQMIDDMLKGRTGSARTATEMRMQRIWQEVLGLTDIDLNRDFVSLGGRSFAAMRILTRIEAEFGKKIPLLDFVQTPTIPALSRIIDGDETVEPSRLRTLVPIQATGGKRPLVFLHVAGSHVVFLQPLARRLGPDQPILAFQPVGLEGEEPPMRSFEEMAGAFIEELIEVQPEGPYRLVGHCAGGRFALEVAYQLQHAGHEVETIVVLDTRGPVPPSNPVLKSFNRLLKQGRLDTIARKGAGKLIDRPVRRVVAELAEDADAIKKSNVDAVDRACHAADRLYSGRRFDGPVVVLRSKERSWKPFEWEKWAGSVATQVLPMRHEHMFFEPDVEHLADALSAHFSHLDAQAHLADACQK